MTTPKESIGRADIAVLERLIVESEQLRADMRTAEERSKFRFRWMAIFLGVLAVALGGLGTLAVQNQRISAQIADCTNSGGACWEESRARSKNNVTSILNTTIFVAECLNRFPRQPTQEAELEECVRRELSTGRQPVPIPTPSAPGPVTPAPRGATP